MSKTPIRAALENLEMQGLVTVSQQRGIVVRELWAKTVLHSLVWIKRSSLPIESPPAYPAQANISSLRLTIPTVRGMEQKIESKRQSMLI